jgi:hypothetical protein
MILRPYLCFGKGLGKKKAAVRYAAEELLLADEHPACLFAANSQAKSLRTRRKPTGYLPNRR